MGLLESFVIVATALGLQVSPPSVVRVADGTVVHLVLKDDLSSEGNQNGDTVHFQVNDEVKVGEVTVIPTGAAAVGHITEVSKRRILGRSGNLNFTVDSVRAGDGAQIPLRGNASLIGGKNRAVTAAATATYGPPALLMRGWNADVRKGTALNAYIDGDRQVKVGDQAASTHGGMSSAPPSAAPGPTAELPTAFIKSTPDGADITVDGKYVGSTPSTLELAAGDHAITVGKSGFKTWQRTMTVSSGGEITISATLEKAP